MSDAAQRLLFAGIGAGATLLVVVAFLLLNSGSGADSPTAGLDNGEVATVRSTGTSVPDTEPKVSPTATPPRPTSTTVPTSTPSNTPEPTATQTSTPTSTPSPTITPIPTVTKVPTLPPTVAPPRPTATPITFNPSGSPGRYEEVTVLLGFDREDAVLIRGEYGAVWYVELSSCSSPSWYDGEAALLLNGSTQSNIGYAAKLVFSDGEVCDVSDAEEPEVLQVIEILPDDDFVLVGYRGNDYVVELSWGCFGLSLYEGRALYVANVGWDLGWGSKLLLPDGDVCEIWGSERI